MWYVYRNQATQRYTVAQVHPGAGWFYAYGPATWQRCWAFVNGR